MSILEQLLQELNAAKPKAGFKHDASGTPNNVYLHGTGGILSLPGLDPAVYSTIVGIEPGILGVLNMTPSVYDHPYFETLTGIRADEGTNPSTECADCKTAGLTKGCTLTAPFGRICRDTREVLLERLGQQVNRSDPMDLQLMNLLGIDHLAPETGGGRQLDMEMTKVLLEYGVSVEREIAQMVWDGNVANALGTGYVPFDGFDLQIATGHVDVITHTSCPSLDSDIKNFNYQLISDTNPADIVRVIHALVNYIRRLAITTGIMPVQWVLAMTPTLFHELTQLWPCRYSTYGCNGSVGPNGTMGVVTTANDMFMVNERDRLRSMSVLKVDGIDYPVIQDAGITEETNGDNANIRPGQMASDIYMIPLTVLGGRPVTYMEYFQFNNPNIADAMDKFHTGGVGGGVWTSNNGAWFWSNARTAACIKMKGVIRPRLILRTPWLAGRIMNVKYEPLQHERTPFPVLDSYFVNGGDYNAESNWPLTYATRAQ